MPYFTRVRMMTMTQLIKAGDVADRYGVSTRTLRYYEEIGLLQSRRLEDYAYRMYDAENIKRLEQILILRKLNINLKDIQRILEAAGTDIVLEVLGQKVGDIDEEVALLQEMKSIVMAFIRQIEQADFTKDADVKRLYDKAREIETQLTSGAYAGNPSPVHRLFEVAERLEQKAASRLQIPDNVFKRLLQNVYFILGDGAAVADELGRRYGVFVYHTCDYRHVHQQHADPAFQPGLTSNVPDFWAQDPEDAYWRERAIVHEYTPMVLLDLVKLSATHERIICENAIDIDSIIDVVTHAVMVTNDSGLDGFIERYEDEISRREIADDEKQRLTEKVSAVWGKGKSENPRDTNPYGIKQLVWDEQATLETMAEAVAEHFGLACAYE